jgi:hypothetical protein
VILLITGDHDVCRNLARLAVAICDSWLELTHAEKTTPHPSVVGLLMKAGSHPSVHVSGMVIPVIAQITDRMPSLVHDLLPALQRRAIIPHVFQSGVVYLASPSSCGVNFHDFERFRDSVLTDALIACWKVLGDAYLDSCTSAVEEFCSDTGSMQVSLHLEAAVFCIAAVSHEVVSQSPKDEIEQIKRCTAAFCKKTQSVMQNPLTLARVCTFFTKVRMHVYLLIY